MADHAARHSVDAIPWRPGQVTAVSRADANRNQHDEGDYAQEKAGGDGEVNHDHFPHRSLVSSAGMAMARYSTGPNPRLVM